MNAFSWLNPLFVAPAAEIERGLFRAPKSYVLVVSKKKISLPGDDDYSDNTSSDSNNYSRRRSSFDDEDDKNNNSDNGEIIFFDIQNKITAAKWLLNASFNFGKESIKNGTATVAFRVSSQDLVSAPRAEGTTMIMLRLVDQEDAPRIFSFESVIRRDVFLRVTQNFGYSYYSSSYYSGKYYSDNNSSSSSDDDDGYDFSSSSAKSKKRRKRKSKYDDDDDNNNNSNEVVWDRKQYQVPNWVKEEEVEPARGVLSVALSSSKEQTNQNEGTMSQAEEMLLAKEMHRNPIFQRRGNLMKLFSSSSSDNSSNIYLQQQQSSQQQQQQLPSTFSISKQQQQTTTSSSATSTATTMLPVHAPVSIFSLPLFQSECQTKITSADVTVASLVVAQSARWMEMLEIAAEINDESIQELEEDIVRFSAEVLSRRSVIEEIESESLQRQQVKQNLSAVLVQLGKVNSELSYPGNHTVVKVAVENLLAIPMTSPSSLEREIKRGNASIKDAAITIERVLALRKLLEKKYSKLTAISDRCNQFQTMRRDIARRVRCAMIYTVNKFEDCYSYYSFTKRNRSNNNSNNNSDDDTTSNDSSVAGFSSSSSTKKTHHQKRSISLQAPNELFFSVDHYVDFLPLIRASDLAGYYSVCRVLCSRINQIVLPQLSRFFFEIRRRLATLPGVAGGLLASLPGIGGGETQMFFDTDEGCRLATTQKLFRSQELTPTLLIPGWKLKGLESENDTNNANTNKNDNDDTDNLADPPELKLMDTRESILVLSQETSNFTYFFCPKDGDVAPSATSSASSTILKKLLLAGGGGKKTSEGKKDPWKSRPDISVALAAKAVADLILHVRTFLVSKLQLLSTDFRSSSSSSATGTSSTGSSLLNSPYSDSGFSSDDNNDKSNNEEAARWEKADEVNTFLWLCFKRQGENNLSVSSALEFGWELVRVVELVFSKCDLIHAVPIASIFDSLLRRIDDGDSKSSTPIRDRVTSSSSYNNNNNNNSSSNKNDLFASSPARSQTNINNSTVNFVAASSSAPGVEIIPSTERSGFLSHVLASCQTIALEKLNLYIATQIEHMRTCSKDLATSGKIRKLLHCFVVFPITLNRLETLLSQQFYPSFDSFELYLGAIVPQMFKTLDDITFHQSGGDSSIFSKSEMLPAQDADLMQFVHHALFCTAVQNCLLPKTKEFLMNRLRFSEARRDQYEQRYILRSLFAKCFPEFAPTAELADGILKRTINEAEAESSMKTIFSEERIDKLCSESIPDEFSEGYGKAKEKVHRHMSDLVSSGDLVICGILKELVRATLKHLSIHLEGSISVVNHARLIVVGNNSQTATNSSFFLNDMMTKLKKLAE